MDFSDVVFVVVGCASGIGKCLCNILYSQNAKVIGTYNKNKPSFSFDCYKCDVSKEKDVKKIFSDIINKYEKIDAVINCAALCEDDDYKDKSEDSFKRVINTNLLGTFLVCKYASLNMDSGVVINMSSKDAQDTYSIYSMDYAASKAGVENLTKNFAQREKKIKYCALAPGWVNTDAVLEMNPEFLKSELERCEQLELIKKEDVALKIIEMIINNDDYISGDIVVMEK